MEEVKETKKKPAKKAKKPVELKDCTKSFAVTREKDGWCLLTSFISGKEIIKQEKVGPNMRAVIVDEFKIEAQRHIENME